jgi:hypothetical protein
MELLNLKKSLNVYLFFIRLYKILSKIFKVPHKNWFDVKLRFFNDSTKGVYWTICDPEDVNNSKEEKGIFPCNF